MTAASIANARQILAVRCARGRGRVTAGLRSLVLLAVVAMLVPGGAIGEQASEPGSLAAWRLDVGQSYSCAIVTGGQVRCWGYGGEGELGYPGVTTVGVGDTPAAVGPVDLGTQPSGTPFTATAISSGDYHTCVIRNDGSVLCWGYGADGRLGYGNTNNVGDTETPGSAGPVNLGGHAAKTISAGGAHTCAILDDGSVRCWGFGGNGQLGYGNIENVGDGRSGFDGAPDLTPATVGPVDLGSNGTAVAITAGSSHTCAILDNGSVLCWGYGGNGRLGYGNTTNVGDAATPGSVGPVNLGTSPQATPFTARAISAGGAHTCAVLDDGSVRCWGFGFSGQLGYGNQNNIGGSAGSTAGSGGPVDLGAGRTAVAITTGGAHTCAILDNGSLLCWGYGADGRLGYGNTSNVGESASDTPGMVGPMNLGAGRSAVAVSAGWRHTCARLDDGSVRCWGYGANGRLGYCGEGNVGDTPSTTPDTAGPVNLVPGDGGELCTIPAPPVPAPPAPVNVSLPSISGLPVVGQVLSEAHGEWSPPPMGYAYQWERCDRAGVSCATITGATVQTYTLASGDVGSKIRVLETASDGAASSLSVASAPTAIVKAAPVPNPETARWLGWRRCLATVAAHARRLRALTHRGSARRRARGGRRLARRLSSGRKRCVKIWGRTPGRVTGMRASGRGKTKIELEFTAPGTDGGNPPAAHSYLIKQSLRPIRSQHEFATADSLCQGVCRFDVTQIGSTIKLTITGLYSHTAYYYAIAALDVVTARPGPRSLTVNAKTA